MKSTNIKFDIGTDIKIGKKVYTVDNFATDDDGERITITSGWGHIEAWFDSELQEGFRDGSIEILKQ